MIDFHLFADEKTDSSEKDQPKGFVDPKEEVDFVRPKGGQGGFSVVDIPADNPVFTNTFFTNPFGSPFGDSSFPKFFEGLSKILYLYFKIYIALHQ